MVIKYYRNISDPKDIWHILYESGHKIYYVQYCFCIEINKNYNMESGEYHYFGMFHNMSNQHVFVRFCDDFSVLRRWSPLKQTAQDTAYTDPHTQGGHFQEKYPPPKDSVRKQPSFFQTATLFAPLMPSN